MFVSWLRDRIIRQDHYTEQFMPDYMIYKAVMISGSNEYRELDLMIANNLPGYSRRFDDLWARYQADISLGNV